jgi:2-keto-3-deoxy-L-rhamnonate aldolase RhmA
MTDYSLKSRLMRGEVVVGTYIQEFYTAGLARIIAATGADFLIFDYEHSGWSTETLRVQLALARGAGLAPIVNSPGAQYEREGLLLDMGATGLMVPHVRTAEQCRALVGATRYPPAGHRGGSFGIAHDDFAPGDVMTTITAANEGVLLIAKLESAQAVEQVDEILAVPGIDVAMVTGFDLSLDLGIPGQLDHPEVRRAQDRLLQACERAGKVAAAAAFDPETARRRVAEGYRFIQYSWDVGLLQEGLRVGIRALRG